MTDLITEARGLCEKATPGPWVFSDTTDVRGRKGEFRAPSPHNGFMLVGPWCNDVNSALIARSRTLIPELADALEKATAKNDELIRELSQLACESVERDKALARLEAEVERLCKAIKEKGGTEYYPTEDAYLSACRALDNLHNERRWIPVTERLPEAGMQVLVAYDLLEPIFRRDRKTVRRGLLGTKRYYEYNPGYNRWDDDEYHLVTHWMPLPEPPEEGAEHEAD